MIERVGGSRVSIGDVEYHFKPTYPGGPHVAEVTDKAHIGRLLGIAEGYEVADDEEAADLPAPPSGSSLGVDGKPETTAVSQREVLEAMSEDDLIANYGPKSPMGLKIDRRMLKETIVERILEEMEGA